MIDQVSSYVGYADQDLVVQTTLDPALQKQAETDSGARARRARPGDEGQRRARWSRCGPTAPSWRWSAARDYRGSQFNRATQALRQPGSAFKAFVFLAAFENGYVPGNLFVDGPIRIGNWSPGNYQDRYYGKVTLRDAFARSMNSVAVQLSERVGRGKVIDTAHRLGITEPLDNNPAIALGVSETTLLEMTGAYATFANQGNGVWPFGIERIAARDGTVLYERQGSGPGPVASAASVRKMLDVMAATVENGTARKAEDRSPGLWQDRHQPEFPRRLVHRPDQRPGDRRVGRQRRQRADGQGDRRHAAGDDLARFHGAGARRHADRRRRAAGHRRDRHRQRSGIRKARG